MKKNKGFTLVELLAVIAILAILVIIALPNVMGMFNTAKKNSFTTEIKEIYKQAQQQWISDSMLSTGDISYWRFNNGATKGSTSTQNPGGIDLTGRTQLDYFIKINKSGKVAQYYATDGSYQYYYDGSDLKVEEIGTATSGNNFVNTVADVTGNNFVCIGDGTANTTVTASKTASSTTACY